MTVRMHGGNDLHVRAIIHFPKKKRLSAFCLHLSLR
jgi:hypothetical protein